MSPTFPRLLEISSDGPPRRGYDRFRALARSAGVECRYLEWERFPPRQAMPWVVEMIASADLLWLHDSRLLEEPELAQAVELRLVSGGRAFTVMRPDWSWSVPRKLGVSDRRLKLLNPATSVQYPHARLVPLSRAAHPEAFAHPSLFEGVRGLLLDGPVAVELGTGEVRPILTVRAPPLELVDFGDRFVVGPPQDLTVAALAAPQRWKGQLLLLPGGLLEDPFEGPMGEECTGLSALDNARFAANLLAWGAEATPGNRAPGA